jgi:hypothetical protein
MARFYRTFEPAPERIVELRDTVVTEFEAQRVDAEANAERAKKRLARLKDERSKLMQAQVAGHCQRHYAAAPPPIRRQINQGFFKKLYLGQDGTVERYELTEPFRQLLEPASTSVSGRAARRR